VFVHEDDDLFSDLVFVSQIFLRHCERLWESHLSLDFSWQEWKLLSSVVLDSAYCWNVVMWTNITWSVWEQSKIKIKSQTMYGLTYGLPGLGFLAKTPIFLNV
jgi:hypothetical protein